MMRKQQQQQQHINYLIFGALFGLIALSPVVHCQQQPPNCDRNLLSICYNQLQPFFLTNNLRQILRGITLNSPQHIANKRSHHQSGLPVPLHRIFREFREFCDLFTTFSECLDAHGASGCMQADLLGQLQEVVITVESRDDLSKYQSSSPFNLVRNFDHYRRMASGFCQQTPESQQIHVVRCLAHAMVSSSPAFKTGSWPDNELVNSGNRGKISPKTIRVCRRWMKKSQAPLIGAFFREKGCGEHLNTAIRLSSLLSEMTIPTTNTTASITLPKYSVCPRHLPEQVFKQIINETFNSLVAPVTTTTEQVKPVSNFKHPMTVEDVIRNHERDRIKEKPSYPVLSIEETVSFGGSQKPNLMIDDAYQGEQLDESNNEVMGVSLMMADAPVFQDHSSALTSDYSSSTLRVSVSTRLSFVSILVAYLVW